jgi:predicted RNA-binding Zn ribbon-like protein
MEFAESYFAGGLYCLNFINTIDHRHHPPKYDLLPDRKTVLEWGRAQGTHPRLRRTPARPSGRAMERVRRVRAVILRILAPLAHSGVPSRADLAALNGLLREGGARRELAFVGGRYRLACPSDDPVDRILCEAVHSAADLLLSNRQDRIRECPECGWMFFDSSRNGSRRWCMMSVCGNRAKARRHYQRTRRAKGLSRRKALPQSAVPRSE